MSMLHKAQASKIKGVNPESRTLTAVISTETQDREGDIIRAAGWDLASFQKNPVIPWAHNYDGLPVAKATRVWVEGASLMAEIQFPPEGDA
ncbi:MAG: hypothetical protein LWW92_15580, partial [Rhodocyclales bacterium]|nr:hypothetical protein [Rhodocyclales bacterium]